MTKEVPFNCSLCEERKDRYTPRVQCSNCARFICKNCFDGLLMTKMLKCPYCSKTIAYTQKIDDNFYVIRIVKEAQRKIEQGAIKDAEKSLNDILNSDSKSIIAWKALGELYYNEKNWENAIYCFSKVLKLNPKDNSIRKKYIKADHRQRSYY